MILSESFIQNNSTFTSDTSDIDLLFEQYENDVSILNEFGVMNESGTIRKIFDKLIVLIKKVIMFLSDRYGALLNVYKSMAQTLLNKTREHKLHIDIGYKRIIKNKIVIYIENAVPYVAPYFNPDSHASSILGSGDEYDLVRFNQFPSRLEQTDFSIHIYSVLEKLVHDAKNGEKVETDAWKLLDMQKSAKYVLKDFPMYSTLLAYRSIKNGELNFSALNQAIKDAEQKSNVPMTNNVIEFPANELKSLIMNLNINEIGRNIKQASRQLRINQSILISSADKMSKTIEDYAKELDGVESKDRVIAAMNKLGSIYSEYIKVYLNALKTQTAQYIKYCKQSIDIRKRVMMLCISIGSMSEDNLQQTYYINLAKTQENDDSNFKKNASSDDDSSSSGAKKDNSSSKNDTKDAKTNRDGQRLLS